MKKTTPRLSISMAYINKLYTQLRTMALQDPIMHAIASGQLSWADASCTDEENQRYTDYVVNDENGNSILTNVQKEIDRLCGRISMKKGVSFEMATNAEDVVATMPIELRASTLVFNPNNVKTIIARNLPRDITMDELRFIFEKYGVVRDIYIPKTLDKNSPYYGTIKGFALIKFLNPDESTKAYVGETAKLHIRGKLITVEFAKEDR